MIILAILFIVLFTERPNRDTILMIALLIIGTNINAQSPIVHDLNTRESHVIINIPSGAKVVYVPTTKTRRLVIVPSVVINDNRLGQPNVIKHLVSTGRYEMSTHIDLATPDVVTFKPSNKLSTYLVNTDRKIVDENITYTIYYPDVAKLEIIEGFNN